MLLKTSGVVSGAELTVEPSAARAIRKANAERWRDQGSIPVLDLGALSRRYGGDNAYRPRLKKATFKVPLGASNAAMDRELAYRIQKWIAVEAKDGWDWCSDTQIGWGGGLYPAYDTDERGRIVPDLGAREFVVQAYFRQTKPKFIRTEVRPELLRGGTVPGRSLTEA